MVYLPTPDEETAIKIAKVAVEERLAACANLFPPGVSVYEWEGNLCIETERILLLKTASETYPRLAARIRELHPYSIPAILKLPIWDANTDYFDWMRQILNPTARF
jgi:periplasmic divalent cation tolerance protein